jgi:hypothetical protein
MTLNAPASSHLTVVSGSDPHVEEALPVLSISTTEERVRDRNILLIDNAPVASTRGMRTTMSPRSFSPS